MATEYGKRLRQARKHAKLTQVQLSEKTGIPQSTISTAEREGYGSGDTPVYADKCGVNALWLGTGEGEMLENFATYAASAPSTGANGKVLRMDQRRPPTLDQVLKDLSAYFVGLDDAAKRRVKSQLADLVDAPEDHNSLAEIMAVTLKTGNAKPGQERLENSTSSRAG